MAGHLHTCAECGHSFACHAPIVHDHEESQNVCILVYDEGEDEQLCDDCRDRDDAVAEPGVIGRIH